MRREPMTASRLNRRQLRQLRRTVCGHIDFYRRLQDRMNRLEWMKTDPLYGRVEHALQALKAVDSTLGHHEAFE